MAVASVEGSANYSLHSSPKWLLLHKSSLEGCANCALHLSPSLLLGSKLHELIVDMSQPYKSSPQKTTHHVVAVGVFLGLIFVSAQVQKRAIAAAQERHARAQEQLGACGSSDVLRFMGPFFCFSWFMGRPGFLSMCKAPVLHAKLIGKRTESFRSCAARGAKGWVSMVFPRSKLE